MVKWKELSRLPKSTAYSSVLWRLQNQGSPNSILQPNWRPSHKPGEQYVEPDHPATRFPQGTFPRVRGHGLEIRLIPQACLRKAEIIFPFQRHHITWEQRVAWLKEQGYTTTWLARPESRTDYPRNSALKHVTKARANRLPALVDKDGNVVGADKDIPPMQLYPPLDWDTYGFPARRTEPHGWVRKLALKRLDHRVPMSLMTAMSKERMGSKRYMRQRLVKKIKMCLGLIISKGAFSEDVLMEDKPVKCVAENRKGKEKPSMQDKDIEVKEQTVTAKPILFDQDEATEMGGKWVMQGWTYLIFSSTALYMMPYSKLITILREDLKVLYAQAVTLENSWLSLALLPRGDGNINSRKDRKPDNVKPDLSIRSMCKSVGPTVNTKSGPTSEGTVVAVVSNPADENQATNPEALQTTPSVDKSKSRYTRPKRSSPSFPGFDNKTWHAEIEAGLKALQEHRRLASASKP